MANSTRPGNGCCSGAACRATSPPSAGPKLARFADLRYKASVAKARGAAGVDLRAAAARKLRGRLPRLAYEATSGVAGLPVVAVKPRGSARMLAILGDDLAA